MVCSDVVETERLDRRRSRLAERRIDRRQQRRLERPLREVLRALETAGKLRHELCTHRPEVLLGQAGMNHVIRQEGDGTREVVVRPLLRADLGECLPEREPIERGRAVAEEPLQDLVDSFLARGSLEARQASSS